jgi:hypothetical protein
MAELIFKTEDERQAAITALGDNPDNLDKLEEIRNSKIGEPLTEESPKPAEVEKPSVEKPTEAKPTDAPSSPEQSFVIKDLKGFKKPEELLKAWDEAQDLIKRQTTFIKEKLSQQVPGVDKSVIERAEKAERELEEFRKQGQVPPQKTQTNISAIQADIQRLDVLQLELDKLAENDPEVAYTNDYQKKVRELQKAQSRNIGLLSQLLVQAQGEVQEAKKQLTDIVTTSTQSRAEEQKNAWLAKEYEEADSLGEPDLKLSKPFVEVEKDYVGWRTDIALAYLGRPAQTNEEIAMALRQAEIKNPDLIQKCRLLNVSVEPSDDVKRYMEICALMDYRDGVYKDHITGEIKRRMKFDSITGKEVPIILSNLKVALQQKRLEEGYYEKQRDGAFQSGAESLANASQRRDKGAVTLDAGSDQGQTQGTVEWAMRILEQTDPETAMIEYRRGNKAKYDEFNKARQILKMDPITFPEEG